MSKASHAGIETRHRKGCRSLARGCNCKPSYRAQVHDPVLGKPLKSPRFTTLADARAWRVAQLGAPRSGGLHREGARSLREVSDRWLGMANAGTARNRSGEVFKPKVLRDYESALARHVLPSLGAARLDQLRRGDVQHLADRLALHLSPSGLRNALMPLRTIYRYAVARDWVSANPTIGIELPASRAARNRIATQGEAVALLAALPSVDQPIWATAFYAGLRLGEIRAIRWADLDFERRLLRVQRSWDAKEGPVLPKSRAGLRVVPMPNPLHDQLLRHRNATLDRAGLVFTRGDGLPFCDSTVRQRAMRVWNKAGLKPIGFHEARHTYASWMLGAGVNAKTLATYMGHSSVAITLDRYGHLMPGSESAAAAKLDAFLAGS